MYMIKISQDKAMDLSHNIEKMLRYGGMAMTCVSDMLRENGIDERRGDYPNMPMYRENYRYPMNERMGGMNYRDDDDWEMNERRGVRGTGRYSRY